MFSECYVKYQKLNNNYDVLWLFLRRPARETKDSLLTAGENGLNIMRRNCYSFKSKTIHVLLGFGCPI